MNTLTLNLSSKSKYAIRLLLYLGLQEQPELVRLKDIALRQKLPLSYLENLIAPLQAGGIIKTASGPRGGVGLSKRPGDIRLSDIIELMEGPIAPVTGPLNPDVFPEGNICAGCAIYDIWNEVRQSARAILESKTLEDLVRLQKQKTSHLKDIMQAV